MSFLREIRRRNVIRVAVAYVAAAWVIIQVVETVFPAFGLSDRAFRIVVIVLAIGFVPTVIGAWAFEWTPEGLKRDAEAQGTGDKRSTRNFDRAIVVILALGIVYFAVDKFVFAPERQAEVVERARTEAKAEAITGFYGDRSIAVLPFDNLSADPEQVYFADGVAEEVLNLLARIRDLRVISRSSSFAFRGRNLEIPEIAEQLDVAHVLEGSVRRAGNRVRVTAQLIEARTDTHLWSKTYERELENLFEIQDEIASDVARNLEITLLRPPRSRKTNAEVVALTQQAKQMAEELRVESAGKILALLERALEIDPTYIPAVKLKGAVHWFMSLSGEITEEEMWRRLEADVARVREIDADYTGLDIWQAYNLQRQEKWEEAAKLFQRALARDMTDSKDVETAAKFAERIGKLDVAARLLRHAIAIDPLCHQCRRHYSRVLLYNGYYEKAIEARERYMLSARGGVPDYVLMLIMAGRAGEVYELLEDWPPDASLTHLLTGLADHALGNTAAAEQRLATLLDMRGRLSEVDGGQQTEAGLQYITAKLAAWLGKRDMAFDLLFDAVTADREPQQRELGSPIWDALREHSRWGEYLAALGMAPERMAAIEFDPWLPE